MKKIGQYIQVCVLTITRTWPHPFYTYGARWFLAAAITLWIGCLDEIDLKNQQFDAKAIILQGKLIMGNPSSVEVSLQRIGDFTGNENATSIFGAKITLHQTSGALLALNENITKSIYTATIDINHPTFKVLAGQSYYIQAILPDGRQYRSDPETILSVPKMEKIGFNPEVLSLPDRKGFIQTDTFLQIWTNTKLSTNNDLRKIKWEVSCVYKFTDDALRVCYAPEPVRPEKTYLYDSPLYLSQRLDSFIITDTRIDHRFAEGLYLTVLQETLTDKAFTYWNQIKVLAERNGNMFEAPAATISSNIKNPADSTERVFGFFYATQQDTQRLYITPPMVFFPRKYCPIPPTPRIGPTICDACLLITGSSNTKPSYWKE